MKQNDLISIIVPVYNVEKYIENSINSILNQTYDNLEILLIDDGSTDTSGKLCDFYEKENKNIKVYHKKNGGLADARNYGLEHSTGKYVCFIDSDDFINKDMIKTLHNSIVEDESQIAACNFKNVDEKFNLDNYNQKIDKINKHIFSKEEALTAMVNLNIGFAPNVCNKLFEKSLFTKDCYFPKGKLYEDMIVTTKILNKITRASYLDCELYYYLQRKNSITGSFNEKELEHIEMSDEVLKFVTKNCNPVQNHFITYHVINCISVINKMLKNNALDINVYNNTREFLKNNKKIIFEDSNLSMKKKIQLYIFMLNIRVYSLVYKIGG